MIATFIYDTQNVTPIERYSARVKQKTGHRCPSWDSKRSDPIFRSDCTSLWNWSDVIDIEVWTMQCSGIKSSWRMLESWKLFKNVQNIEFCLNELDYNIICYHSKHHIHTRLMLWSFWIRTFRLLFNSMRNQIGSVLPFGPKQSTTSNILKLRPLQPELLTTRTCECHSILPWALWREQPVNLAFATMDGKSLQRGRILGKLSLVVVKQTSSKH